MSLRALRNCDWSGDVSPLRQDCRIVAAARTRRHSDVTAAILDMRHRIGRLESSYFSPHSLASRRVNFVKADSFNSFTVAPFGTGLAVA